jgi:hypothetical protein
LASIIKWLPVNNPLLGKKAGPPCPTEELKIVKFCLSAKYPCYPQPCPDKLSLPDDQFMLKDSRNKPFQLVWY